MWLDGWTLNAAWELAKSSFSVATLIGAGATFVAVAMPKQLDWITDLRKWAMVVAIGAFSYSSVAAHHYSRGLAVKQAEWDAAIKREAENGEQARKDAENSVPAVVDDADRSGLRNDPYNRKRRQQ